MEQHFVVTSHPTSGDLEDAICEAVKKKVVVVTATEESPDGDELAKKRLARTRNLNRTFLLVPLQVFFEPVLVLIGQDRRTGDWVTIHQGKTDNEIKLVSTHQEES